MVTRSGTDERTRIYWGAAAVAGLLSGLIFLVLPRAVPWLGSGLVAPGIMGREIDAQRGIYSIAGLTFAGIHLALAIVYSFVLVAATHRLEPGRAVAFAAMLGLGLYALNWLVFTQWTFTQWTTPAAGASEWPVVITHVVFAMAAVAIYQGRARDRDRGFLR